MSDCKFCKGKGAFLGIAGKCQACYGTGAEPESLSKYNIDNIPPRPWDITKTNVTPTDDMWSWGPWVLVDANGNHISLDDWDTRLYIKELSDAICDLEELRLDKQRLDELLDGRLGIAAMDKTAQDNYDWYMIHDRKELDEAIKEAKENE